MPYITTGFVSSVEIAFACPVLQAKEIVRQALDEVRWRRVRETGNLIRASPTNPVLRSLKASLLALTFEGVDISVTAAPENRSTCSLAFTFQPVRLTSAGTQRACTEMRRTVLEAIHRVATYSCVALHW